MSNLDINNSATSRLNATDLCEFIKHTLDDDKAEDLVAIDLSGKCDFADYMIVASGRSQRHVSAMASKLAERLKDSGNAPLSLEGQETGEWVLIDAGDIIVHLFHPEKRAFYNIEKMWEVPMAAHLATSSSDVHA